MADARKLEVLRRPGQTEEITPYVEPEDQRYEMICPVCLEWEESRKQLARLIRWRKHWKRPKSHKEKYAKQRIQHFKNIHECCRCGIMVGPGHTEEKQPHPYHGAILCGDCWRRVHDKRRR